MNESKKIELLKSIDSYIKGRLSQKEIDALWIEFLKYPEMFRYFETEVQIQDMIRKGNVPESFKQDIVEEPKQTGPAYKIWLYTAAAAVILAVALQFFSVQPQNVNTGQWALTKIELDEMVSSDIYRSDGDGAEVSETDLQINSAMAMAYNDSTIMAIEKYRELIKGDLNNRQLVRSELNLGILLYNNGDYEEAKGHFERITRIETVRKSFKEKGWWLYGNTLLNTGDISEAREAVYNAYQMNGHFREPALELLNKLDAEMPNRSLRME